MRGYAVGAVDYLVKPVVPEFVRSKVSVFVELAKKTELLRRQAEQLRESEQAARELAETRAELVRDLEHKNRELESFSYAVSHDLRAPLRRIEAFSRAVLESQGERLDAVGRRFFDRIQEASRQMSQLIDDVLHLSKVTRAELRQQEVDLSALADRDAGAAAGERARTRMVETRVRPGVVVTRRRPAAPDRAAPTCWRTPGSSPRRQPAARIEFGLTSLAGESHLLRARQRRGLRHGLRRPALRSVPAAAPRHRVPRLRDRARHGAADHPPAWAAGSGPKAWWARAPPSTSPSAGPGREGRGPVNGLPEDVHSFLHQNIESVEQLEVLLLLWRAPERGWTSDEVATAVYSHPSSVVRRLAMLLGQGLLREREPGCYQYAPRTAELHATVTRLDHIYRERRVAVITLIASKPIENVRAFSDAFRIRRKKEE